MYNIFFRNVILELRAGTGGDEASLFTGEMLEMYERFAALQGWRFQTLSVSKTGLIYEAVAVREATASVSGPSVYAKLKFESGVHRVQRIPLTEGGGRVHTSTMSVVVLPEPEEIDVELKASDLVVCGWCAWVCVYAQGNLCMRQHLSVRAYSIVSLNRRGSLVIWCCMLVRVSFTHLPPP